MDKGRGGGERGAVGEEGPAIDTNDTDSSNDTSQHNVLGCLRDRDPRFLGSGREVASRIQSADSSGAVSIWGAPNTRSGGNVLRLRHVKAGCRALGVVAACYTSARCGPM